MLTVILYETSVKENVHKLFVSSCPLLFFIHRTIFVLKAIEISKVPCSVNV